MLRAVFVDMDDTFVAPDKTIPAGNLRVLDLAHERGVQVVPCTGRSVAGLPPELVAHPSVRYAVCGGGAIVYDVREDRLVSEEVIGARTVRALYEDLRDLRVTFDLFADDRIFTGADRWAVLGEMDVSAELRRMLVSLRTRFEPDTDALIDSMGERACRINVFCADERDRETVRDIARAHPELTCVSSLPCNAELTRAGVDKGSGLRRVCELMGVDAADLWRLRQRRPHAPGGGRRRRHGGRGARGPRGGRSRGPALRGRRRGALPGAPSRHLLTGRLAPGRRGSRFVPTADTGRRRLR